MTRLRDLLSFFCLFLLFSLPALAQATVINEPGKIRVIGTNNNGTLLASLTGWLQRGGWQVEHPSAQTPYWLEVHRWSLSRRGGGGQLSLPIKINQKRVDLDFGHDQAGYNFYMSFVIYGPQGAIAAVTSQGDNGGEDWDGRLEVNGAFTSLYGYGETPEIAIMNAVRRLPVFPTHVSQRVAYCAGATPIFTLSAISPTTAEVKNITSQPVSFYISSPQSDATLTPVLVPGATYHINNTQNRQITVFIEAAGAVATTTLQARY